MWSKFAYYQDLLNKSEKKLNKVKADIDEINRYLELVEKPYGLLLYRDIEALIEKNKELDKEDDIKGSRKSVTGAVDNFKSNYKGTVENILRGTLSKLIFDFN